MSRQDASRLLDIVEAIEAINDHLTKGSLDDGLTDHAIVQDVVGSELEPLLRAARALVEAANRDVDES